MRELHDHILSCNCEEQLYEFDAKRAVAAGVLSAMLLGNPNVAAAAKPAHHHGLTHKAYSEQDYVNAIIGEASNQGYEGMLAIAGALRNRAKVPYYKNNVLHGVYGLNNPQIKIATPDVRAMAEKAWKDSATKDITKGAYLWGSDSDIQKFKVQAWFKNVSPTTKIKDHTFFKDNV